MQPNLESALECLSREINEELPGTVLDKESIQHYKIFRGISPHKGDLIENDVYFAKIKGTKLGYPGKEISEARWIKNLETYNLSDVTFKVINSLITKGYVNYEILKS